MVNLKKIRNSVVTGVASGLVGFGGGLVVKQNDNSVFPIQKDSMSVIFTHPGYYLKPGFLSGQKAIIRIINNAKSTVHIQAYNFTDQEIAKALIKAASRGIKVYMLLDKENEKRVSDALELIINAKHIPVKIHRITGIAHSKIVIADGGTDNAIMYTGSFNLSKSANTRNVENLLIIKSKDITAKYLRDWEVCWQEGVKIGDKTIKKYKDPNKTAKIEPNPTFDMPKPDKDTDVIISAMKVIDSASHYMWISLESMVLDDDFINKIRNARAAGADVRVLIDSKAVNAKNLRVIEKLKDIGIRVKIGNTEKTIIVCDDKVLTIFTKGNALDLGGAEIFYAKTEVIEKGKKGFIDRWNDKKHIDKKAKRPLNRVSDNKRVFRKTQRR